MAGNPNKLSKLVVIGSVALIILGTLAWIFTDQTGQKGINPKAVKKMAKAYEKVCLKTLKTKRACKKHIGRHHLSCVKEATQSPEKGDELVYNAGLYEKCMIGRRLKDGNI